MKHDPLRSEPSLLALWPPGPLPESPGLVLALLVTCYEVRRSSLGLSALTVQEAGVYTDGYNTVMPRVLLSQDQKHKRDMIRNQEMETHL